MTEKSKKAYIYKIVAYCDDFDEKDTYYGSTTQPLCQRIAKHRQSFNSWLIDPDKNKNNTMTSFITFQKYGLENCKILLVEEVDYIDRNNLRRKEGEYILNNACINMKTAGLTPKESDTLKYIKHKEKILESRRIFYELNKERIQERRKTLRSMKKNLNKD